MNFNEHLGESMIECTISKHTCKLKKVMVPMWFCFQIEWLGCQKHVLQFKFIYYHINMDFQ
jgi:hypothetical protein